MHTLEDSRRVESLSEQSQQRSFATRSSACLLLEEEARFHTACIIYLSWQTSWVFLTSRAGLEVMSAHHRSSCPWTWAPSWTRGGETACLTQPESSSGGCGPTCPTPTSTTCTTSNVGHLSFLPTCYLQHERLWLLSVPLCAVNRRMDDWVNLEDMELSSVELPGVELDATGHK